MKAILILDEIPGNCLECPLGKDMSIPIETCIKCPFGKCVIDEEVMTRPNWCPLKPVPSRFNEEHFNRYEDGYNTCIDEILGDKE